MIMVDHQYTKREQKVENKANSRLSVSVFRFYFMKIGKLSKKKVDNGQEP